MSCPISVLLHSVLLPITLFYFFTYCSGRDVVMCSNVLQRINAIVLAPYDLFSLNKRIIIFNYNNITRNHTTTDSFLKNAHSVHAVPSSSRPTCPSFFFLLHVASFLVGSRLLIFSAPWGPGPPSPPSPELIPFPSSPGNTPLSCREHLYHALSSYSCLFLSPS